MQSKFYKFHRFHAYHNPDPNPDRSVLIVNVFGIVLLLAFVSAMIWACII